MMSSKRPLSWRAAEPIVWTILVLRLASEPVPCIGHFEQQRPVRWSLINPRQAQTASRLSATFFRQHGTPPAQAAETRALTHLAVIGSVRAGPSVAPFARWRFRPSREPIENTRVPAGAASSRQQPLDRRGDAEQAAVVAVADDQHEADRKPVARQRQRDGAQVEEIDDRGVAQQQHVLRPENLP